MNIIHPQLTVSTVVTSQNVSLPSPVDLTKAVIIPTGQFTSDAILSATVRPYQAMKLRFLDDSTVHVEKAFSSSVVSYCNFMVVEFPDAISLQYIEGTILANQSAVTIPLPTTIDTTNNRILVVATSSSELTVKPWHCGTVSTAQDTQVIIQRGSNPAAESYIGAFIVELPPL